jgi:hypothetical protein
MNFETIIEKNDNCPIVLIDRSGSTYDEMIRVDVIEDTSISVLDYEVKIATDILMTKGIKKCYLGFWNSSIKWVEQNPIDVYKMVGYKPNSSGGGKTLYTALESIDKSWLSDKEVCEIYIFTDGKISDDSQLGTTIKNIFQKNTKIQIITVEPNYNNYFENNNNVGNKIYEIIKNENLMGFVKKFMSYNQYHLDTPYVSFVNPEI